MIGILAEKPSAARNMAKALGAKESGGAFKGNYNGEDYLIVAARGHLYGYAKDPAKHVDKALASQYGSWNLDNLPWNEDDFKWKYEKKPDSDATLKNIKAHLSTCTEVCIATDDDPTGEGELLAWEILDNQNIAARKWSRMYFVDESPKELQKAFKNRKTIKSMMDDMDYVKALYRTRWDYLSMQFTRIATKYGDGHSVLRQGRLKSAMVLIVGDALKALNAYKKIPYYQNRFRDENGVVYSNPDEPSFSKKEDVPNKYHDSDVIVDSKQMKSTAPPKLLDLASLSARLSSRGMKADNVLKTYQKMYEAQVVSYPRTEDKVITPEQFDELLPLVDKIAGVVGVDTKYLTHRSPRATHVKTGGAHGANRPGPNVPSSLASLDKFDVGKKGTAQAIYEILASNYLAMLAEDYEYEAQKGHLKNYPDFKGTASVPKKLGWKQVFNDDADIDPDDNAKGLGTLAKPFVHEGFPPKPPVPTMKWLMKQLEKRDVGTGATRTSTYADVTNEKTDYPLLKDTKGKITMTQYGDMSYLLLPNTNIGSLDMTERLMSEMRDIANGKMNPKDGLHKIQQMVKEDLKTMLENSKTMHEQLDVASAEKYEGIWNGKETSFKREWSGHRFTDDECAKLLKGEDIEFEAISKKTGKTFTVKGHLEEQIYKKKKFVGFKGEIVKGANDMADDVERVEGTWNGKQVRFKREWSGHRFTDDEAQRLLAGEVIEFDATSKAGKPYKAKGKLAEQEYNGNKFVGFQVDFGSNKVPDEWCQHKFTDDEKALLESGMSVECDDFVSKKGSTFTAKVRYGKNDKGFMGIIPEF